MSEDKPKEQLPPVADPLLETIKNYLLQNFEAVQEPAQATYRYTTAELYQRLQRLYPDLPMDISDLAQWLHQNGYRFWDAGDLRLEWLLKG